MYKKGDRVEFIGRGWKGTVVLVKEPRPKNDYCIRVNFPDSLTDDPVWVVRPKELRLLERPEE